MVESSDEWLDKQKKKLQALKDRELQLQQSNGYGDYNESYLTSKSHSALPKSYGESSRDNKQLVEELKTKQHTWKQEKTEKTTEYVEDDSNLADRSFRKTTYRLTSPERPITQSVPVMRYESPSPPPPQQICPTTSWEGGGESSFREARYFSETKKVEEEVIPSPPMQQPPRYHHYNESRTMPARNYYDSRLLSDDCSRRSQGYNTLTTSEEEYETQHKSSKQHQRDNSYCSDRRTDKLAICPRDYRDEEDVICSRYPARVQDWSDGGRLRSKSFGGDQVWSDYSYLRRADGKEWREGDFNPSPSAAHVFREALQNVGPDGEIIYTSRRYDTSNKHSIKRDEEECRHTESSTSYTVPEVITRDREIHHYHHPAPVLPAPQPIIYYPVVQSYVYPDDQDVIVTETYKRTKETRYEEDNVIEQPQILAARPIQHQPIHPVGREVSYRRTFDEERCATPPPCTTVRYVQPSHQVPQTQYYGNESHLKRSHSTHDMLDNSNRQDNSWAGKDGGTSYYYRKTTTYEDDDNSSLKSPPQQLISINKPQHQQQQQYNYRQQYQQQPQQYHQQYQHNIQEQQQHQQLEDSHHHSANYWSASTNPDNRAPVYRPPLPPQHVMDNNSKINSRHNNKFYEIKEAKKNSISKPIPCYPCKSTNLHPAKSSKNSTYLDSRDENYYASNSASSSIYDNAKTHSFDRFSGPKIENANINTLKTSDVKMITNNINSDKQLHSKSCLPQNKINSDKYKSPHNQTLSKHEITELEMFLKDFN